MRCKIYSCTIWFDQIIRKIKSIQLIIMVNAERRMKTDADQASGYITSDHSIAIIQPAVNRIIRSPVKALVIITEICFRSQRLIIVNIIFFE